MALDTSYVVAPPVGMPPMFSDPCDRPVSVGLPPPRLIPGPIQATASGLDYLYLRTHVGLAGAFPAHPQTPPPGP